MSAVVADTHALSWYLSDSKKLSSPAREAMNKALDAGTSIYVSAISFAEAVYLAEKGRILQEELDNLAEVTATSGSGIELVPVDWSIVHAMQVIPRETVPELPDRIIGATALHLGLPLVTRDTKLQASQVQTIW